MGSTSAATAALILAVALSACGGGEEEAEEAPVAFVPEPAPLIRIAMAERSLTIDPLLADSRAERLAARQVHEPLISTESGPFGQTRARFGLARPLGPHDGGTVWRYRLRSGVAFQDGARFDSDAVAANVERWLASSVAIELLPGLRGVDSPQPGLVRFLFSAPVDNPDVALSDGRLGIVSPAALNAMHGGEVTRGGSGTGPFELRADAPGLAGETVLARNSGWWGASFGLGPGVDQIVLALEPDPSERLASLEAGDVRIADQLDRDDAAALADAPLLTVIGDAGTPLIAFDRSVRGLASTRPDQSLADVWLTTLR